MGDIADIVVTLFALGIGYWLGYTSEK